MTYYVYAIGLLEYLVEPYSMCYIGVTNNLHGRFKQHQKSKYTIGRYIREHYLSFERNMITVFEGTEKECFQFENVLRPYPMMGLNEAIGGKGGYSSYSRERNKKVSKALRGRKIHWADKISETKKTLNQCVGSKNSMAKRWKAIDPNGIEYFINGTVDKFCKEHKIISRTLCYYRGNKVPSPEFNGYGGYRAKSDSQKELRMNTTGWTLLEGDVS